MEGVKVRAYMMTAIVACSIAVANTALASNANALLGSALATGDFNGDGFEDVAASAPGYNGGKGRVMVTYGRAGGLAGARQVVFDRPTDEDFGTSLATGDFNDDGLSDLAIGSPWANPNLGGGVWVFYGTWLGLSTAGSQFWTQDSPGIAGASERADGFGTTLAAGDFGKDGADDLAIGVPDETVDDAVSAGMVHVIYGNHDSGLSSAGSQTWHRNTNGIPGACAFDEAFGGSLAAGNFGRGSYMDLAIGIPQAGVDGKIYAGAVLVLYGTANGLSANHNDLLTKLTDYVPGDTQEYEFWGTSLVAARFNDDAYADLAISGPGDSSIEDMGGSVSVIYATSGGWGFSAVGPVFPQQWKQDSGIGGSTEYEDEFGRTVAAGDFNDDGISDLVVGTPFEQVEAPRDGMINVIYGTTAGLATAGSRAFHQNSVGIKGDCNVLDRFGAALATGDFDGDGVDDVAIGVPEDSSTHGADDTKEGLINVIEGRAGSGLTATENVLLSLPH